jgi:gluconolactonase
MLIALVVATLFTADVGGDQLKLLKTFRDEFVSISPGEGAYPKEFEMGDAHSDDLSQKPVVKIEMGRPFSIARYEVPQNLWAAVMGSNPSRWKGERNSVEMLSAAEAEEFCRKATDLMRSAKLIEANAVIRLPSEAEWEYCARAGTKTNYSWGDDADKIDDFAWYTGNAAGNDPPVGAKKPNAWGLYDMHGYLWEICADNWNAAHPSAPTNALPRTTGDAKQCVVRSGSWKDKADALASASRRPIARDFRDDAIGLRCVLAEMVSAPANESPAAGAFEPTAQEQFVAAESKLETLWADGEFTEGPAVAPDGSILFSDIGTSIYRFDPQTKQTALFRQPSGRSNGLMFDAKGRLIACEGANTGGNRRISITEGIEGARDGKVRTLSDNFEGKRFNSPNDLAIDGKGNVYFTDPRYVGDDPRDLDFEAVFLVAPNGKTTIATRDVQKPNGILVAPDGKTVYVADNHPTGKRQLLAFTVQGDGTLAHKRVLFDFASGRGIDGMTLDKQGNIFATAGTAEKAGIYVFSSAGKPLAFIPAPGDPTNCVFGSGTDASSLYITASTGPKKNGVDPKFGLFRVKLKTSGR